MKKQLNIDIGKRIRQERERANLTREQLAELVDVTPRFIADVERGHVGISILTLKKICEVLHISSDALLWGKPTQTSIDDKLKLIDSEYAHYIEKLVQTQLDFISFMESRKAHE